MIRSSLLRAQLQEALAVPSPEALAGRLAALAAANPELAQLLQAIDATYARFGILQQATVEIGSLVVSEWDMKSGRIDSGKTWKVLLGYALEDVPDTVAAWRALAVADDLGALSAAIAAHVRDNSPLFSGDCRMRTKQGGERWLRVSGRVASRDESGEPLRLIVVQQDIDASRQMEESLRAAREAAESAGRSRTAFLANMSHEIRTPMNAILGMTELALDTDLDAEQRHYLGTVRSSCEALLTIVNDILDFSKIEAGKLQVERIDFELSAVVFEAVRSLAIGAQQKGLDIVVEIPPEIPVRVWGDPLRLRQVLTNLVGNAIKFTDAGSVSVLVRLQRRDGERADVVFEVRDTGIGIPADKIGQLFQAFTQADASTTRRFGGTGLGLAICARLVDLMGGKLGVASEAGRGSVFGFVLPFGVKQEAAAVTEVPSVLAGQRVLVAGLAPATQRCTAAILERWGAETVTAGAIGEAKALCEKWRAAGFPVALVILDADEALADGGQLLSAWASLPEREPMVTLVSVSGQRDQLPRLKEMGLAVHVVKPVAAADLLDAVRLAVGSPSGVFQLDSFNVEASLHVAGTPAQGLQILVVEDNPVNQELAQQLLAKAGHRVTLAANGEEAVEAFDSEHFDVILMDMQMPVMDGLEATQAIRARELRRSWVASDTGFRQVPIIAMTANAMSGDRERCLQAGMTDYVAKPIRQADLFAALGRAMSGEQSVVRPAVECGSSAGARFQAIDPEAAIQDIGDPDLVRQMARMLLEQWDSHVTGVSAALAKHDAQALCRAAHTFKGLLAMFHAEEARRHALAIELAAKDEKWSAAAAAEMSLRLALEAVRQELMTFAGK
ncbi:MAG: response regulator [Rhodocyclaceae bacterium]|nr:response regulator [Rhodocyclaceae bacterium]